MADKYRPRVLLIIVCALIIAQIFVIMSLTNDVEKQTQEILAARQAVNIQTLMQSALINRLIEKNVITREEVLLEAQEISERFMETPEAPPFDTTGLIPPDADRSDR